MEKAVNVTYDGKVFRPDEPVDLAWNTKGTVIINDQAKSKPKKKLKLVALPKKPGGKPYGWIDAAIAARLNGPSDFSENLDDYIYRGKPFVDEE